MPSFICKSPVAHDGKEYAAGDFIELSAEQAAAMPWAVDAAPEAPKAEEKPPKKGK